MSLRVLVTGGGGFLGQNIVRRLRARGDQVRIFARGDYRSLIEAGVEHFRGDVRDKDCVLEAVKGVDSVFHVASKVGYWGARKDYEAINIGGALNVVQACTEVGVSRLIYTSTPSVVIGTKGGLENADETTPYPSRHLYQYAATKARAEAIVLEANGKSGLRTVALRPHFIFGPGDPQIVPRLVENAKKGTLVRIGDGTNKVDVTYIDNAVDAHILAHDAAGQSRAAVGGQAYFIGQEKPVLLWEFVDAVLRGFGVDPVRKRIPIGLARLLGAAVEGLYRLLGLENEPPITRSVAVVLGTSHFFSHEKARRDFGYDPKITIEEGLRRLFAHAASKDLEGV